MKVCELIEWLKREDPLYGVEIDIKDSRYPDGPGFISTIDRLERTSYSKNIRIVVSDKIDFSIIFVKK